MYALYYYNALFRYFISFLQDEGVDINLVDGDEATPLHFAASRGHTETVSFFKKNKPKFFHGYL